jgi:hypothetical protein
MPLGGLVGHRGVQVSVMDGFLGTALFEYGRLAAAGVEIALDIR